MKRLKGVKGISISLEMSLWTVYRFMVVENLSVKEGIFWQVGNINGLLGTTRFSPEPALVPPHSQVGMTELHSCHGDDTRPTSVLVLGSSGWYFKIKALESVLSSFHILIVCYLDLSQS